MKNKKYVLIAVLTSFILVSCTFAPKAVSNEKPQTEEKCYGLPEGFTYLKEQNSYNLTTLEERIFRNEVPYVEKALKGKTFLIQCSSGVSNTLKKAFSSNYESDQGQAAMTRNSVYALMTAAAKYSKNKCPTEIIQILHKSGVPMTNENATTFMLNGCGKDIVENVIFANLKGKTQEQVNLSKTFADRFMSNPTTLTTYEVGYNAGVMKGINEYLCNDGKQKDACDLKPTYEQIEARFEKIAADTEQQTAYMETAEYIAQQLCPMQFELLENQKKLDKEKKIINVSGVGNKEVLHKAGSRVVELNERIEELKKEYKKRAGKPANVKELCKL